jgi:sugar phosphate isomerase/epimerase
VCDELKISAIDTLCPGHSLQEKLCLLEQLRIEGIELESALSWPLQEKKKVAHDLLSSSKVKLSAVLIGYQGNLLSKSKNIRKRNLDRIKEYMDACAELNGVGVVTIPSPHKKRNPFQFLMAPKKETKKLLAAEQYRTLGKYAQELGIYILIEPLDRSQVNFINTCNEAAEICRMTGSDAVRICPDLFHMSIEEREISEKIHDFSEYILHLHIGDNDSKSKFAILPGRGKLDFRAIFDALKKIRYSNYLSLDCLIPSKEELASSVQYLRELEK